MRCFLAIGCPDEVKDELVKAQEELLDFGRMKAVEYENLHLTLKFLGDIEDIEPVTRALERVGHSRFAVTVKGLGAFPSRNRPRVLWAGVEKGSAEVSELHGRLEEALEPLGFSRDGKFHPHITLARVREVKDSIGLKTALENQRDAAFGEYEVGDFTLMESRLSPGGPEYSRVREYRLK
ncbi:MAG: RNA 2',3'-cyclic phosphodiesterase [Candidatus Altiarchaeales archaeon]|nr:RNA 2',3'-cyclic phosphodiesterase [Candidatus Altiarchaeales archaeon]MBD3415921.1 RNA 2',3'-cyclic phosphodiesterase [Candidatus Altiarchaeales archaeon]